MTPAILRKKLATKFANPSNGDTVTVGGGVTVTAGVIAAVTAGMLPDGVVTSAAVTGAVGVTGEDTTSAAVRNGVWPLLVVCTVGAGPVAAMELVGPVPVGLVETVTAECFGVPATVLTNTEVFVAAGVAVLRVVAEGVVVVSVLMGLVVSMVLLPLAGPEPVPGVPVFEPVDGLPVSAEPLGLPLRLLPGLGDGPLWEASAWANPDPLASAAPIPNVIAPAPNQAVASTWR